jgi:hypothetical protein
MGTQDSTKYVPARKARPPLSRFTSLAWDTLAVTLFLIVVAACVWAMVLIFWLAKVAS